MPRFSPTSCPGSAAKVRKRSRTGQCPARLRCALLGQQVADVARHCLPNLSGHARCAPAATDKAASKVQPRARKPAKPPVGLVDRLLKHLRPKLAECRLDVPAPQARPWQTHATAGPPRPA
jgi:hypothetical protein